MLRLIGLGLIACLFSACFTIGKNSDSKSSFDKLNGKNYEGIYVGPGFAIIKDKERSTQVQGVLRSDEVLPTPMAYTILRLQSKNGRVNESIRSDSDGKFYFIGVYPKGDYQITIESKQYYGRLEFKIDAWEIKDLILEAKQIL